tara:strand:+ start:954 stop:1505 length:552 start_codon:yes stop_codon:yes gene_type:complete
MAATEIKVQMQQRRDTASGWVSANPTLLLGELGYESDTGKWKVGDGSSAWSSLAYSFSSDAITEGDSKAEVIDTGSDGRFVVTTENVERVRVGPAGQIGIAGANYGTSGQVLTSGGPSGAITWSAAAAGATGGGTDEWALEHDNTITTTYTIATGKNVISAGPLSINAAATITVPANSFWVVV